MHIDFQIIAYDAYIEVHACMCMYDSAAVYRSGIALLQLSNQTLNTIIEIQEPAISTSTIVKAGRHTYCEVHLFLWH